MSKIHSLYLSQYGNANGKPVLYLHGGPGGGCARELGDQADLVVTDDDARRFNPEAYRIVCVDQRGAGKSTPASCLEVRWSAA